MPELPACGNYLAGTCERNEVYVAKETDDGYIIYCRCCRSSAYWPKDKSDEKGKYEAFMQRQSQLAALMNRQRPIMSLPSVNPGVKQR